MVLVDTSVWVAHFRASHSGVVRLLTEGQVLTHPFVVGELACGNLARRERLLSDLAALPAARRASDEEVMQLVTRRRLWGRGIDWVDAHLLASALLTGCALWTLDPRFRRVAHEIGGTVTTRD